MNAESPSRVVRLPRWNRRDARRTLVIALPLLLGGSFGPAFGTAPAAWQRTRTAGDPDWLNALTGPVPTSSGAPAGQSPEPGTPVLPVNGDPQHLALTGMNPAEGHGFTAQPGGSAPPVGDVTATADLTSSGIPLRVLQAYLAATNITARTTPNCHLTWSLLAGIGRVESNHGRYGNAKITSDGLVTPPIYGPTLDGTHGMPRVADTDGGRLDGISTSDRAVGPMQFLPGTWTSASVGADADGDGVANPQDVDDAALSSARYLCLGGGDLGTAAGRWQAVYRYNRSSSYVSLVLALADSYATGKASPIQAAPSGVTTGGSQPPAAPSVLPGLTSNSTQLPTATVTATATATVTPTTTSTSTSTSTSASTSTSTSTSDPTTSTTDPTSTSDSPSTSTSTSTSTTTTTASTTEPPTTTSTTSSTTPPPVTTTSTTTSSTPPPVTTSSTTTTTTTPPASTTTPPAAATASATAS